jgi:predicted Zn finger-like uncharacterized protein
LLIRCERCATLYELEEALLAPTGSQVQCTKCQNVFTAFPSHARGGGAGESAVSDAPPAEERARAAPAAPREEERAPAAPAEPRAPAAPSSSRADARAPRSGAPPIYRPPTPTMAGHGGGVGRSPVLKRDAVGSFEARLRWTARWRWLAPTLAVVAVIGAAAAAWLLLGRAGEPAPAARREALSLVARDDAASLDEAIARLDAVASSAEPAASAERALAHLMRAGILLDEREALAGRRTLLVSEAERLRREQPEGWEDAEGAAADEARELDAQARALEEQARMLGASALEALRAVQAEVGDTLHVARGIAAYHALGGDRVRAEQAIRTARDQATPDPWLDLVQGTLDAGAADRDLRERAAVQLAALASAHPELLRGRYLLARAQASLGRRAEALVSLERVLADNPRHAGAARLRDDLAEIPEPSQAGEGEAQAPAVVPSPTRLEARPAEKPSATPRKIVSRAPAGSPPEGDDPIPTEAPPPVESASVPAPVPAPAEIEIRADPAPAALPGPADTAAAPLPRPRRDPIRDPEPLPGGHGG